MNTGYQMNQALTTVLAQVMKALFTKEEIELLVASQIGLPQIVYSGAYDGVSRADGQKMMLTLMSRWPIDDANDVALYLAGQEVGSMTPRSILGASNYDSILEKVVSLDTVRTLVEGMKNSVGKLFGSSQVSISEIAGLNLMTGAVVQQYSESDMDAVVPFVNFADANSRQSFIKLTRISRSSPMTWSALI